MTDPTSQNIKPDTELLATIPVSTSSDLKVSITMELVFVLYVLVMILAIIKGIYFVRRVYLNKSLKLSNITLHEQDRNDYEFSMDKDKEKDVEEKTFSL